MEKDGYSYCQTVLLLLSRGGCLGNLLTAHLSLLRSGRLCNCSLFTDKMKQWEILGGINSVDITVLSLQTVGV